VQQWLTALGDPKAEKLAFLPGLAAAATFLFTLQQRFSNTLLDPVRAAAEVGRGFGVGRFRDKLSFRHRFAAEFSDVTRALKPLKVVILIDDLDRCQPTNVLEVLESVNFLVSSGDCYVVMGLDRERVLDCVGHGFKQVAEDVMVLPELVGGADEGAAARHKRRAFAEQYLEKLINIEIPVPRLDPAGAQKLLLAAAAETRAQQRVTPPARGRPWALWLAGAVALAAAGAWLVDSGLLTDAVTPGSELATQAPEPQGQPEAGAGEGQGAAPEALPLSFLQSGLILLAVLALFGALAVYAALTYRRSLISIGAIVGDSEDFRDALDIWYPLIARKFQTPRALKRFLNRMRYLAMCSRRGPVADQPPLVEALDEATLVALAAAADCLPGGLEALNGFDPAPTAEAVAARQRQADAAKAVDSELAGIVAAHRKRFRAWPPSDHARATFHDIAGGVVAH